MIRIHPFAAVRPQTNMAARVAAPPYDVVDADEAWAIVRKNPLSFLRVTRAEADLPPETEPYSPEVYAKGRANLEQFIADGILNRTTERMLYVYRQVREGRRQVSVMGCCHVDDYESGVIRRHEKTRADKEADRTKHIDIVNAQTGPVFLAYRDDEAIDELMRRDMNDRPLFHFVDFDGVTHTVWAAHEPQKYVEAFARVPRAYIADGHHRAASAANVAKARRMHGGGGEAEWFLAALFPVSHLNILPYHRLLKEINGLTAEEVRGRLRELGTLRPSTGGVPEMPGTFEIYLDGDWLQLELGEALIDPDDPVGSLDVALLQRHVLEPIFGIGDPRTDPRIAFVGGIHPVEELRRRVDRGDAMMAIAMHATSMEQLLQVADAGLIMPPKSTWFEPKLRDGLLVHEL
jgi:uncharacterized protein (DUF1015 family)